jgi:hypothetical protein
MITEDPKDREEAEKRQEAQKQLRFAYARLFASADGLVVLEDLKRQFGFYRNGLEKSTYTPGLPPNDFIHRDGAKQPVRHILKQITPDGGEISTPTTKEAQ